MCMSCLTAVSAALLGKLPSRSYCGLRDANCQVMMVVMIAAACSFANAVRDSARLVRDLGRIFRPVLLVAAVPAVLAIAYSKGLVL